MGRWDREKEIKAQAQNAKRGKNDKDIKAAAQAAKKKDSVKLKNAKNVCSECGGQRCTCPKTPTRFTGNIGKQRGKWFKR